MIVTKAPSKVILFGEHAVVYDKLGIVATTAESTRVELGMKVERSGFESVYKGKTTPRNFEHVKWVYKDFSKFYEDKDYEKIEQMDFDDALTVLYYKLSERFGRRSVHIETEQDRDLKGLGGSAATFAAFTLGYAKFTGNNIEKDEIVKLAKIGDMVAHGGKASGIDINAVTYGGYLTYKKSEGMKKIAYSLDRPIIIVNSGEKSETKEMVSFVGKKRAEDPKRFDRIMDNLERTTKKALVSLEKKDVTSFGSLMYDYYSELHRLDISTKKLDEIIDIAKKNDALGAKPTGAWGGGNCIVLAKDAEHMVELMRIYNEKHYNAFSTELGVEGVHLE